MHELSVTQNDLTEDELVSFGSTLAGTLAPGDVVLLQGQVGAGKTSLARSIIQAILVEAEDIPSPTFTLVQTYDTHHGPLWHVDLYRLTSISEIEELGLFEAFDTAICLVEWPELLGQNAPASALTLTLAQSNTGEARDLTLQATHPKWEKLGSMAQDD